MKRVKASELKVGLKCVVNELTDATIYTVEEVNGRIANLKYQENDGQWFNGGIADISMLMHPSRIQLK